MYVVVGAVKDKYPWCIQAVGCITTSQHYIPGFRGLGALCMPYDGAPTDLTACA